MQSGQPRCPDRRFRQTVTCASGAKVKQSLVSQVFRTDDDGRKTGPLL